jgi:hypothetical protein
MLSYWLVVVVSTPLKNMKVNGNDDIPYVKWKIRLMFETTNQLMLMNYLEIAFCLLLSCVRFTDARVWLVGKYNHVYRYGDSNLN